MGRMENDSNDNRKTAPAAAASATTGPGTAHSETGSVRTLLAETGPMAVGVRRHRDGDGIPLVLVPAFPLDARMWDACAREILEQTTDDPALAAMPVLALEMPGSGSTPVPSAAASGRVDADGALPGALDAMAESFVAAMRLLGYEQAVWVGVSMGGYAVLDIQRLHPETVAGIGLLDSKPTIDSEETRRNRLEIAAKAEEEESVWPVMGFARPDIHDSEIEQSPAFVEMFRGWIGQQSPEGVAWRERMAAGRPDLYGALDSVSVPMLVLTGELDPLSGPSVMRPLARRVASAVFVLLPRTGHFTPVERPAAVATALTALCRQVVCSPLK